MHYYSYPISGSAKACFYASSLALWVCYAPTTPMLIELGLQYVPIWTFFKSYFHDQTDKNRNIAYPLVTLLFCQVFEQ